MKSGRIVGALLLVFCLAVAANADQANAAFKRGVQAESKNKYDEAFQAFAEAHNLKPRDAKYFTAFTRLRFYAAGEHIRQGQLFRDSGKLQEALAEFQRAAAIDPTNFVAKGEARHTEELIKKQAQAHAGEEPKKVQPLEKQAAEAAGPVELQPLSNTLITLRLTESSTNVYKTVGRLAGINVLFDQDYKPQKITVELNDVTLREALNTVALQTKTFWEAISSNSILVAADTASKRKEMQDSVMKTFYLRNVSNPTELQEVANTLRGILDVTRIQLVPKQNAMIIRGTTDQLVLVQKLLSDIDKPKPEVVIEVAVLQVSRTRIRTIGVNPPTSANVVMVPNATGGAGGGGSGSGAFTINTLGKLTADNFQVSIPGASLSYLMSDGDTRLIQNPQIRAVDNEKATLKIGDRVPVATGSFGAAAGGGGISALVNTQFQYLDVGVNIDITPHIHADNEVTLKMTLEVSSVSGTQNIGGISQPVIGQRRIEHEARLQDGEVNLVGGILEDTETNSLSGYPLLTKIPILKYLFAQEDKQRRENEIVFAITPHIIRAQEVNDDNLRMVDLGRGNSVSVGHSDPRANSAAARGMDQNSGRTVGQRKNTMPPVASPAPTKSFEPPKAPVQVPVSTATSSLIKPAKAAEPESTPPARTALQAENNVPARPSPHEEDIPPLRAAAAASVSAAPSVASPVSSAPARTVEKAARNANHPATSQGSAEQCPSGTRLVGTEGGITTCSFD